jgi:AraC-like DNA-binding protein
MIISRKIRDLQLKRIATDAKASFVFHEFNRRCYPFFWHYHPELELAYAIKGRGQRFVGDSIQDFDEGDVVLVGANVPHSWYSRPAARQATCSVVVQFLPDCLGEQFLNAPETRPVRELFARAKRGLVVTGRTRSAIAEILEQMRHEALGSLRHLNAFISILTTLAESNELKPLAVTNVEPVVNRDWNRKINQMLSLINTRIDDLPAQSDVAKQARLSPQAFSRFFKRCLGKTYMQYVNELRIGKVCRALLETDLSVTEAAYGAGFNNLSNFNEQFRKLKSMTPSEYRELAQVGGDRSKSISS